MHLLEVKSLRVLYGKAMALNGLTLSLEEKEIVGVVGPNGAGKTTLLRAISAMIPVEGEILFQGERIDRHPPHEIVRQGHYPLPGAPAALRRLHGGRKSGDGGLPPQRQRKNSGRPGICL